MLFNKSQSCAVICIVFGAIHFLGQIASANTCEALFRPEPARVVHSAILRARVNITPGISSVKYVTAELAVNETGRRLLTLRDNVTSRLLNEIDLDSSFTPYGPILKMQIDVYRNITFKRPDDAAVHSERRGHFLNRHYVNFRPVIYLIEANKAHVLEYLAGVGYTKRQTIDAPGIVYVEPVTAKLKDRSGLLPYLIHDTVRIYFGNGPTTPIVYDPVFGGRIDASDVIEFTSRDPLTNL